MKEENTERISGNYWIKLFRGSIWTTARYSAVMKQFWITGSALPIPERRINRIHEVRISAPDGEAKSGKRDRNK